MMHLIFKMNFYFIPSSNASQTSEFIKNIITTIQDKLSHGIYPHILLYFDDQPHVLDIKNALVDLQNDIHNDRVIKIEICTNNLPPLVKEAITKDTSSLLALFYLFYMVENNYHLVPIIYHIYETDGVLKKFFSTIGRSWIPARTSLLFNDNQHSPIQSDAAKSDQNYMSTIVQLFKLLKDLQPETNELYAIHILQQHQLKLVQDHRSKRLFLASDRLFFDTVSNIHNMCHSLEDIQEFLLLLWYFSSLNRYDYIFCQLSSPQTETLKNFFDAYKDKAYFLPSNVYVYSKLLPTLPEISIYGHGMIDYISPCFKFDDEKITGVFLPPQPIYLLPQISNKLIRFQALIDTSRQNLQPSQDTTALNITETVLSKRAKTQHYLHPTPITFFNTENVNKAEMNNHNAYMIEHFEAYSKPPEPLPEKLSLLFGISSSQLFKIPNITINNGTIVNVENVHLPILAVDEHQKPLLQQENITLLMKACWEGNEHLVETLLKKSDPHINAQSNVFRYTALDLLILSEQSLEIKHKIITLLLSHGASLDLQNIHGKCSLFHAIDQREKSIIQKLLHQRNNTSEQNRLMSVLNARGQDAFLYAMDQEFYEVSDYLMEYLSAAKIQDYISNHRLQFASENFPELQKLQIRELKRAIKRDNTFDEEAKKTLPSNY